MLPIISFNPPNDPLKSVLLLLFYFTDEETKAQKNKLQITQLKPGATLQNMYLELCLTQHYFKLFFFFFNCHVTLINKCSPNCTLGNVALWLEFPPRGRRNDKIVTRFSCYNELHWFISWVTRAHTATGSDSNPCLSKVRHDIHHEPMRSHVNVWNCEYWILKCQGPGGNSIEKLTAAELRIHANILSSKPIS